MNVDVVEPMEIDEESHVKHVKPKKMKGGKGKGDAVKVGKGKRKDNIEVIDLTADEIEDSIFKDKDDDSDDEDELPELEEVIPMSAAE